jgi:hypothetical protein
MDSKIKEAIFRQVEQEPFAKKFDLKLVDLDEAIQKLRWSSHRIWKTCLGKPMKVHFLL